MVARRKLAQSDDWRIRYNEDGSVAYNEDGSVAYDYVGSDQEQRAVVPYADDTDIEGPATGEGTGTPYVTVVLSGMPMRFKASHLRQLISDNLMAYSQLRDEQVAGADGAKVKAFQLAMKAAITAVLPVLRQAIKLTRENPLTPPHIKRMLPEMQPTPRHADKTMFLMAYFGDVIHAALTRNAWVLDVEPDPDALDSDALRIAGFRFDDPATVDQAQLPIPAVEIEDAASSQE